MIISILLSNTQFFAQQVPCSYRFKDYKFSDPINLDLMKVLNYLNLLVMYYCCFPLVHLQFICFFLLSDFI